ncbi:hypothetical protein LTR08_001298 [Meristemomyces frigidus]|nr:hypothetical protein LTR08_001298 [Meristemomyces frigidus]
MAQPNDREAVPGTDYLVDVDHNLGSRHARGGKSDVNLIPQPTSSPRDPLTWSPYKKYYQLFLLALYACAFSFGENNLGAAWTTVSEDIGVTIQDMNAGSALNYLLLGFGNIFWIPLAMKLGRRIVFLTTTCFCLASAVWTGYIHGLASWMLTSILNGVGTSAYQAVIQLSIFDMFFVHERGRGLSYYLFGQQLGSILGLITGGTIADTLGWRWSQFITGIIEATVLVLLFLSFEETLFPRVLFSRPQLEPEYAQVEAGAVPITTGDGKSPQHIGKEDLTNTVSTEVGENLPILPERTMLQRLELWTYYPQDRTPYWTYFCRPLFLFAFPNIVIAGVIFAFGCTAGIVSFNTISEILTEPPYNWSTSATGLVFLAALVGNFVGWGTGVLADFIVVRLARRNGGVKEPEMRLWTLCFSFLYAAVGYLLYGWGAQNGLNWFTIAFGVGCMIAHQVSACSVATAYAMDCFPGISGEIVVVLAICSSLINFTISETTQPLINAVGYGWAFTFYCLCVIASTIMAIPLLVFGKSWRKRCGPRYYKFLSERGGPELGGAALH